MSVTLRRILLGKQLHYYCANETSLASLLKGGKQNELYFHTHLRGEAGIRSFVSFTGRNFENAVLNFLQSIRIFRPVKLFCELFWLSLYFQQKTRSFWERVVQNLLKNSLYLEISRTPC